MELLGPNFPGGGGRVCADTNILLLMPRAVLCHEFGPPETLSVEEVEELSDCRPKEAVLR